MPSFRPLPLGLKLDDHPPGCSQWRMTHPAGLRFAKAGPDAATAECIQGVLEDEDCLERNSTKTLVALPQSGGWAPNFRPFL